MSNGGDLPLGAHARRQRGGSARGRVGNVRRDPPAVKGQLRDPLGLVGFRVHRVVAASAPAAPRSHRTRGRAAATRCGSGVSTSGTSPLIAALLWLPLAVLELTGVAHGVDDRHRPPPRRRRRVNVFIVLVFELLVAEILAAASEKIVASDLHGAELPSPPQFLAHRAVGISAPRHHRLRDRRRDRAPLLRGPGFMVATWGVVTGPVVVAEGTRALNRRYAPHVTAV